MDANVPVTHKETPSPWDFELASLLVDYQERSDHADHADNK